VRNWGRRPSRATARVHLLAVAPPPFTPPPLHNTIRRLEMTHIDEDRLTKLVDELLELGV